MDRGTKRTRRLSSVPNLRAQHPMAKVAPADEVVPPELTMPPRCLEDVPWAIRAMLTGADLELGCVDPQHDGTWIIWNSPTVCRDRREARRLERKRVRQKLQRHGLLVEPDRGARHLASVPAPDPEAERLAAEAARLEVLRAIRPTKGRAMDPAPAWSSAPAGPPVIVGTRAGEDDDWWDPSTGTLVMPVSVAVQARLDLVATRDAAHTEALVMAEDRRLAELERRTRQTPSHQRKAVRKAARKNGRSEAKMVSTTNRDHARFGVPLNQVALRHQVVLERPALRALSKLRKSGETGRLTKVVGALDVLRTEGPDYPSLRTKRYGGPEGTGADGEAIYQSNAENGTPGAWRIRWSWGEPDDQGRARIRVLDLHAHSSTGWGHGGAG